MTDTQSPPEGMLPVDPIDRHALLRQLKDMTIAPNAMNPEELRDFIVAAIENDRVVPSLAAEARTRDAGDRVTSAMIEAALQAKCIVPGVRWDDGLTEGVARIEWMQMEKALRAALSPKPGS